MIVNATSSKMIPDFKPLFINYLQEFSLFHITISSRKAHRLNDADDTCRIEHD